MHPGVPVALRRAALAAILVTPFACGPDDPPPRCTTFDPVCAPLYEPTFEQIFQRTFKPSCALSGASCHAETGRQGGIAFEDPDRAHALLLETGAVKPGDATCSELAFRIRATEPFVRMPPGRSLSAAEQCTIQKWIADGAKR